MQFQLIDSHCHIHFRAYRDDMDEVINRAVDNGIAMITVGTQTDTSSAAVAVAERYDGVWAAIGLHPNHLHKQEFIDTNEIIKELPPSEEIKSILRRVENIKKIEW